MYKFFHAFKLISTVYKCTDTSPKYSTLYFGAKSDKKICADHEYLQPRKYVAQVVRDGAGVTYGNHRKLAEDTLNGNEVQDRDPKQVFSSFSMFWFFPCFPSFVSEEDWHVSKACAHKHACART